MCAGSRTQSPFERNRKLVDARESPTTSLVHTGYKPEAEQLERREDQDAGHHTRYAFFFASSVTWRMCWQNLAFRSWYCKAA